MPTTDLQRDATSSLPSGPRATALTNALTAAWVVVILLLCVVPAGNRALNPFRTCILCSENGALAGFILNVALYVPLGFGLRLRVASRWLPIAAGGALSLLVEMSQLFIPGRFSALEDLLANTGGAALGGALAAVAGAWLLPRAAAGRRFATAWSLFATLVVLTPAVALRPTVPSGGLFAQWTPALGGRPSYPGRVLTASVGGVPLPNGAVPGAAEAQALLRGPLDLDLAFEAGPPTAEPLPVLRMVGDEVLGWPEVLQVGVAGTDLIVRFRYRADDVKMDRPDFRVREALGGVAEGDTVHVVLGRTESGVATLTLDAGRRIDLAVPAARGWSLLLYPSRLGERWLLMADVLWIMMLFAPLGWWNPDWRSAAPAAIVPAMALLALPVASALVAPPLLLYGAAALTVVAGAACRSAVGPALARGGVPA